MKKHKFLFLGILLLLISSSTSAYTPNAPGVVEGLLFVDDKDGEVELGQETTLRLLIKNSLNDSIHNITVFQELPENTDFLSVMGFDLEGNNISLTDETTTDFVSGSSLSLTYLNVTNGDNSNFTANIDHQMQIGDQIGFSLSINITETGSFDFIDPQITYYDHWGDQYEAQLTSAFVLNVFEESESPIKNYLPTYLTTETDYTLIIGSVVLILVVALLGRMMYLKKPFEL